LVRLLELAAARIQEVTLMGNDWAVVVFDDERAVANASVMLPAALAAGCGSWRWSIRRSISATGRARRIRGAR
jgi:hypothetical protein